MEQQKAERKPRTKFVSFAIPGKLGEEAAATLLSVSNEKTAKVYARVTAEGVREIMERLFGEE